MGDGTNSEGLNQLCKSICNDHMRENPKGGVEEAESSSPAFKEERCSVSLVWQEQVCNVIGEGIWNTKFG